MKRMFTDRDINTFEIAFASILANKLRATLTALGIIFGVSAIITMMAIGKGAEAEILEQLEATGVNNIIINARIGAAEKPKEEKETEAANPQQKVQEKNYSKGLNLVDASSLESLLPTVEAISPEAHFETSVISSGLKQNVKLIGITEAYYGLNGITIDKGASFNAEQTQKGLAVCIIGSDIKKRFFTAQDAVGNYLKCGRQWLKVVGVASEKQINKSAEEAFGIRNANLEIYVPIKTLLLRFQNQGLIRPVINGEYPNGQSPSIHQVQRITVKINSTDDLSETGQLITKILKRRHNNIEDFEVVVPELLLKQQQKTKEMFSLVLSIIAGISLLVGGIGIMNIMLASVLERTKEIGTRLAIGAQKRDIVKQFLFEAILISLSGGIIGIVLGVTGALVISKIANIHTIISNMSIIISFFVSTGVGIIFGYSPALKAAKQNPIDSLRYE